MLARLFLYAALLLGSINAAELLTGTRLPDQTSAGAVDGTPVTNSVAYGRDGSLYVSGTRETLSVIPHVGSFYHWSAWVRKLSNDGKQQAYFSSLPDGTVATAMALATDGSVFVVGGAAGVTFNATPGVFQRTAILFSRSSRAGRDIHDYGQWPRTCGCGRRKGLGRHHAC